MSPGLADVANVLHLVNMVGWLPLLKLAESSRGMRQALHQQARALLVAELAERGLVLQPTTPLPFGILVHLLYTMVLSPIIRHDCKAMPGSWWHGPIVPNVECRVAVRYKFQSPRRQWPRRVATGLRRVRREDLVGLFLDGDFAGALRTLAAVGDNFCFHRFLHESLDDAGGYLLGLRVRVLTLYCTVKGFELYLRWSHGCNFDPADSSSGSSTGSD